MSFNTLDAFTKKVADMADQPSGTPAEIKAGFDAAVEELRQSFNNLVNALKSTTSGDSGAKNTGATPIPDLTGSDTQSLLESLKALTDKKIKGNGELLQSGRTNTLTVPAGQTFGFDYNYPSPYSTGIVPIVTATPNGSIANCADLVHSVTNITNTGFRIEIKNKGTVDEYAFYNWNSLG